MISLCRNTSEPGSGSRSQRIPSAVAVDQPHVPGRVERAVAVLWARGEHEAAMDLYQEVLGDDGGPRAIEYQAWELAKRGDRELALELTRHSFAAANGEAFTGLAWCYVGSDQERGVQVLGQALLAGDRNALRELAIVHMSGSDLRLAQKFCELAVRFGDNALPDEQDTRTQE